MGQGVPQGRLAGVRVLIADDDNVYRSYVRRMLETGSGMNAVADAVDGEEGVTLSRLLKPDLVLMDLDLPPLDGLQATRRLKGEVPLRRGSSYFRPLGMKPAAGLRRNMALMRSFLRALI